MIRRIVLVFAGVLALAGAAPSPAQQTAEAILARSVAAHGGARLSSWKTLQIVGTIEMEDGITYRAAYRISAKMPDKLKVEQDMTADHGRLFYEYFLNGTTVWTRRNLITGRGDARQCARWMNQCFGIAYYARKATALALKPDTTSDWLVKSESGYKVAESRPAFVVAATTPDGTADLYIDKKTFYLLQETTTDRRRLYSAFRDFGGTVHPTRILEIAKGRNGDVITPIAYDTVRYNLPLEDWLFEEDMPRK